MKWIHSLLRLYETTSKVFYWGILIVMILVLLAGYGAGAAKAGPMVFELVKETYSDRAVNISYPQISKMNDAEIQDRLNHLLKSEALSILNDYDANDLKKLAVKLDYIIGRQDADLLSVQFIGSRFLKGTPYPTALFQSINLDMQAGRKLRLQEIVQVNDQFVETIIRGRMNAAPNVTFEILRLDNGKLLKAFGQADSVASSENPERAFSYFTKEGLGISFSVVHVLGDHVEFVLPMVNLSSFIKPDKENVIK